MELAPLLQDLVTGDVHQVMELDPLSHHPWSASRVRRNSEIRMVQVRQMRREFAQLLDGNQNKTTRIRVISMPPNHPACPFHPHTPSACDCSTVHPIGDATV
ncbi:hypothetical protein QYE76_038658 [Lolium multiflorum]|uniref:Uncharacterized protein n=1 Tax=Lolium multiflorum TaxID=4521 RepID=A0AAD8T7Y9_LOLMU|nr:hypothetical protein QYE76_038658 [Lolium multiflorum]